MDTAVIINQNVINSYRCHIVEITNIVWLVIIIRIAHASIYMIVMLTQQPL